MLKLPINLFKTILYLVSSTSKLILLTNNILQLLLTKEYSHVFSKGLNLALFLEFLENESIFFECREVE